MTAFLSYRCLFISEDLPGSLKPDPGLVLVPGSVTHSASASPQGSLGITGSVDGITFFFFF